MCQIFIGRKIKTWPSVAISCKMDGKEIFLFKINNGLGLMSEVKSKKEINSGIKVFIKNEWRSEWVSPPMDQNQRRGNTKTI